MRKPTRRKLAAAPLLAALALALATPGGAIAGDDPNLQLLDDYCSPTGDLCLTAMIMRGRPKLQIATPSVSGRYELCVRGPERKRCKEFKLSPGDEGINFDRVDLQRKFGKQGDGRYKAVWKIGGDRVGEALRFRLPHR